MEKKRKDEGAKYWSLYEENRLRELWYDHDIKEICELMDRTEGSILSRSYKLKLRSSGTCHNSRKRWSETEEKYLIENWGVESIGEIAIKLNRSQKSVREKAIKTIDIDYYKNLKNRVWTDEEVEYLEECWGSLKLSTISKNLGRTPTAIMSKVSKLNLGFAHENTDDITFKKLCEVFYPLGSYYAVKKNLMKHGIPVYFRKFRKRTFIFIKVESFWEWAENNKALLDFSNFQKHSLGMEPIWVDEKRKEDIKLRKSNQSFRKWTDYETEQLKVLLKRKIYTLNDIAKILNRSENSVKSRIKGKGFKDKPIAASNRKAYSEYEVKKIIELYNDNYSTFYISNSLDRSQRSIEGKIMHLKTKGILK